MSESTQLLTVAQVAEQLNVTRRMVYRLIEEKNLETVRLGERTIRITQRAVENLIRGRVAQARA
jgi:excisionase family DNA binding protein